MKKLIGGNFKLNMSTYVSISEYVTNFTTSYVVNPNLDIILAPQMALLQTWVNKKLPSGVSVAAQTMAADVNGAFTGETSPVVLQELGLKYVILGHSERRQYYNETDMSVNKKTSLAITHGMRPIICIGETLAEKEAWQTLDVLHNQLEVSLANIDRDIIDIAYEPVRAIGTGKTATSDDVRVAHAFIRSRLGNTQTRIIYGGSVKDTNAAELNEISYVDGFLVGGASLDPKNFLGIINAVSSSL